MKNILIHSPKWLHEQLSGGEMMMNDYMIALQEGGYNVAIYSDNSKAAMVNGVQVFDRSGKKKCYDWAELILTHLGSIGTAINECRKRDKPLIYIVHNTNNCTALRVKSNEHIGVIYNSHFTSKMNFPVKDSMIGRPCLYYKEQKREGNCVTMVNLNENKGGHIFKKIAEALPEINFIGIKGGYGNQVTDMPSNVSVYENGELDMSSVYQSSCLVVMPSKYESWGRVAAEAITSGVPVLHSNTPGLNESVGCGGMMVEQRDNIDEWVDKVRKLAKGEKAQKYYQAYTRKRSEQLIEQAKTDKKNFLNFVQTKINNNYETGKSKSTQAVQ